MPEEPEVEIEKVDEAVHEAIEREGGRLVKAIAMTTALLATLAAFAALLAGATVNEALALKTEAARLQSEAADQWAYYQAKGIKAAVQEASRAAWFAIGKEPPANFEAAVKRYAVEQEEIQKAAREREHERDAKSAEADHLFHRITASRSAWRSSRWRSHWGPWRRSLGSGGFGSGRWSSGSLARDFCSAPGFGDATNSKAYAYAVLYLRYESVQK
jgi:Domain of unknown function (DUF4337)